MKKYTSPYSEVLEIKALSSFLYVSVPDVGDGGEEDW